MVDTLPHIQVHTYRMCHHYLACNKLLISPAIVAITTSVTCDEPSASFKVLLFSTLIPIPALYTQCLIHSALSQPRCKFLMVRTTADRLSFVYNISKCLSVGTHMLTLSGTGIMLSFVQKCFIHVRLT